MVPWSQSPCLLPGSWSGARRREREEDGAPLLQEDARPTGHLTWAPEGAEGGGGARKEEERRQTTGKAGIRIQRDTCAMAAASLGVECSLRGSSRSGGPSVAVPVRSSKSTRSWSKGTGQCQLGFWSHQAFWGGSFGLAGVRSIGRLANPARGVGWGRVPRRAIQRVPSQQGGVSVPMLLGPAGGRMSLGRLAAAAVVHFCAGFQCSCP